MVEQIEEGEGSNLYPCQFEAIGKKSPNKRVKPTANKPQNFSLSITARRVTQVVRNNIDIIFKGKYIGENKMKVVYRVLIACLIFQGCAASGGGKASNKDVLTVGTVQRQIKVGMSGADVLASLGSPNIVSTDEKRREVWVYDKMCTTVVSSSQSGFVFLLLAGGGSDSMRASSTQRTLTIIIKFDGQGRVRDYKYHSSSF